MPYILPLLILIFYMRSMPPCPSKDAYSPVLSQVPHMHDVENGAPCAVLLCSLTWPVCSGWPEITFPVLTLTFLFSCLASTMSQQSNKWLRICITQAHTHWLRYSKCKKTKAQKSKSCVPCGMIVFRVLALESRW